MASRVDRFATMSIIGPREVGVQWGASVTLVPGKWRQEDQEFKVIDK